MRELRITGVPWKRVGAALPALALIGVGSALAVTGSPTPSTTVAEAKPLVTVPLKPLEQQGISVLPPLPELPPLPALATLPDGTLAGGTSPGGAGPASAAAIALGAANSNGIPQQALTAYQRAAALVNAADSACRIDWALVAAIGKVESNHGRFGGNGLDGTGTVRPGIYGIPLNGSNNTAVIRDTDGGTLDRDTLWDRAVGPMQFIPGTWRTVGVDASGDGVKDPQNMTDAATATAVYLCSGPGDLTQPDDLTGAIKRYNNSDDYARLVIAIAQGYRTGVTVLPATGLTDAQRTGNPYLPTSQDGANAATARRRAAQPPTKSTPAPARTTPRPATAAGTSGAPAGGTAARPRAGSVPRPSPSATSGGGLGGAVTGAVGGVTAPLTGVRRPTPAPTTPRPSPTTTTPAPVATTCVINVLGVRVCTPG